MARTVKTFRVTEPETPPEPFPFALEFIPKDPDAEPRVEHFEAFGKAPAGAMFAMAGMIHYGERGRRDIDMNGMREFFSKVMDAEDYERFFTLLDSPEWTIDMDLVGDVFTWLTEEYSGRPTKRSRRSSRTGPGGGRSELSAVIPLDDDSVEETSST